MLWFVSMVFFGLAIGAVLKGRGQSGLRRGVTMVLALLAGAMGTWLTFLLVSVL